MTMKQLIIVLVLIATPVFGIAQERSGRPSGEKSERGDRKDGHRFSLLRQLNLTNEQKQEIHRIRKASAENWRNTDNERKRAQIALDEAIYADTVDQNLVEQRARELGRLKGEVTRMQAMIELQIRKVLTTEQLNIMRNLRKQITEKQHEDRSKRFKH
jgi:Spy/CpxP family protein refolding chaperone